MSVTLMLNDIIHSIKTQKAQNNVVVAITTDISKAYDCVSLNKLEDTLKTVGIPSRINCWILQYLSKRILQMKDQDVTVTSGLPQGCCLSPMLFNIYSAPLHSIEDENTLLYQYADDFFLLSFGNSFEVASLNLQNKANRFKSECDNRQPKLCSKSS